MRQQHSTSTDLVAQEARRDVSAVVLRPEADGVRERVHGQRVAADEVAAEVDAPQPVQPRLRTGESKVHH